MIAALTRYGALSAKARAMYGKRLKAEDFRHIAGLNDLDQVLEYLRTLPGWEDAVSNIPSGDVRRSALEAALRNHIREDYVRLSAFIPREDKFIAAFPIMLAELEAILSTLRRLRSGHIFQDASFPPAFLVHSKLNYDVLRKCVDYDGLLRAAQKSIYYTPLLHLRLSAPGSLPDYTVAEALLRSSYFSTLYREINKRYAGETRKLLTRALGEQVDLLNIIHLLRLKKYFPGSDLYLTVLFPFHYKLKPAVLQALIAAPDIDAAFALLQTTVYGAAFNDFDVAEVEDYYRRAFYLFNRKQLVMGTPSIYSAISYLNLRDLEQHALVNAIECVKYGTAYDDSFTSLLDH